MNSGQAVNRPREAAAKGVSELLADVDVTALIEILVVAFRAAARAVGQSESQSEVSVAHALAFVRRRITGDYEVDNITEPASARAPMRFTEVYLGQVEEGDFRSNARSALGTRTATLHAVGIAKLRQNWVYKVPASPKATAKPGLKPQTVKS